MKPEETLVEARSGSDVQIVRHNVSLSDVSDVSFEVTTVMSLTSAT